MTASGRKRLAPQTAGRSMTNEPATSYLTVTEAAAYLNTSDRFVRRLVAERRIAFHHVGRHVRLATTDLEAFIRAGRVEPITPRSVRRAMAGAA